MTLVHVHIFSQQGTDEALVNKSCTTEPKTTATCGRFDYYYAFATIQKYYPVQTHSYNDEIRIIIIIVFRLLKNDPALIMRYRVSQKKTIFKRLQIEGDISVLGFSGTHCKKKISLG